MKLTLGGVAEFVQGAGDFDPAAWVHGYSIDSRTIQAGQLFFAIRGERLDGHDFVEQALAAGAVAAVVKRESLARLRSPRGLIAVEDTTHALQTLGAAVRRLWGKRLVGITGSTGKTTTKECIAHVLGSGMKVLKSTGNLNNQWGMPMQLLRLEAEDDIAVLELGMSHAGEIAALAALAAPEVGVVTNVAPVHLEFFDSIASIARAKYELIESLPAGGIAVLNADDEYVSQFGRDFHGKVALFGLDNLADYRAENIAASGFSAQAFDVVGPGFRHPAALPLLGRHNLLNALAAVAVAVECGIAPAQAVHALATLAPSDKRGEILQVGGATIINDCYNSNPKALRAMTDTLAGLPGRRRVVVAGEMLELGPQGPALHEECGRYLAEKGVDFVLGVRGLAEQIVAGARGAGVAAEFVATPEEAGEWLAANVRQGDVVLVKASRGVRLEKALEMLRARRG